MSEHYAGDPIQLTLDTGLDLTAATNVFIKYRIDNNAGYQMTADKYDTTYAQATIPKDRTQAGRLSYQPYVSWDSGETYYHGDEQTITIQPPIEVTT